MPGVMQGWCDTSLPISHRCKHDKAQRRPTKVLLLPLRQGTLVLPMECQGRLADQMWVVGQLAVLSGHQVRPSCHQYLLSLLSPSPPSICIRSTLVGCNVDITRENGHAPCRNVPEGNSVSAYPERTPLFADRLGEP